MTDYKKALKHIQKQEFHQALNHLNSKTDMTPYAEIQRLAYTQDMINNYTSRLIDDLAQEIADQQKTA